MPPTWEPDKSASACPLCSSAFTFLNRRHHCRKCGRVVCGECSQQQIRYFASTTVVGPGGRLTRAGPYETYRTCDECAEEIRMIRRALAEGAEGDAAGRVRSPHDSADDSDSSVTKYLTHTQTRVVPSSSQSSAGTPRSIPAAGGTNAAAAADSPDDASDRDLCPVCAANLRAQFGGGDFEAYKEAHVSECLTQFDFNLNHQRSPQASGARNHTRNKMLVYNIPPIPRPQFEECGASGSRFVVGLDTSARSAMLEKHPAQECVICLEDLKPGDKVGRLECLCVFHYKCIKDWFNKRGFGECPVHFLHK